MSELQVLYSAVESVSQYRALDELERRVRPLARQRLSRLMNTRPHATESPSKVFEASLERATASGRGYGAF